MTVPAVSVIIPVYNAASTLSRAIDSALSQDGAAIEIVAVDDGSTDGSAEVLGRYGDRIRVLSQPNRGAGAARTAGVRAARGEFVAFLDADDEWLPGKVAAQLRRFAAEPSLAFVASAARSEAADGTHVRTARPHLHGDLAEALLLANPIVTSGMMVRRSALEGLDPLFRSDLFPVEDWELWIRLAARGRGLVSPDVHVRYLVLPSSGTRSRTAVDFRRLHERMYATLAEDPVVAPLVARHRRRIRARIDFLAAYQHYEGDERGPFLGALLRSIARAPLAHPWRSALAMLVLPRRLRDRLRAASAR